VLHSKGRAVGCLTSHSTHYRSFQGRINQFVAEIRLEFHHTPPVESWPSCIPPSWKLTKLTYWPMLIYAAGLAYWVNGQRKVAAEDLWVGAMSTSHWVVNDSCSWRVKVCLVTGAQPCYTTAQTSTLLLGCQWLLFQNVVRAYCDLFRMTPELVVPQTHNRSLSAVGPQSWNNFPLKLWSPQLSFDCFRRRLKTRACSDVHF